jgi:hypothetical protein
MAFNNFLKIFNPKAKLALHIVEAFIIVVVIILCVVRMVTKNSSAPRSQIDRMGLAMVSYQSPFILHILTNSPGCQVIGRNFLSSALRARREIPSMGQC